MLPAADPRSGALSDACGAQWLGLGDLMRKIFDLAKSPKMTTAIRAAMEGRRDYASIASCARAAASSVFTDSDYTFLNGTLATLTGDRSIFAEKSF